MNQILPLTTEDNRIFILKKEFLKIIKEELETFCSETNFSNNKNFPKEILFTHELKNNNAIEGYYEDLSSIIKIINNPYLHIDKLDKEYQRILNLFKGYEYILKTNNINKDTLRELYQILSVNLLSENELLKDNSYYRDNNVYIYFSNNLSIQPDMGFASKNIEKHMNELFNFINTGNDGLSEVELFFKSQIIHFYLVYIHPYFDINGRTSRTTSLWFLNNNDSFPYTIFNRAITYNKKDYYKIIREVKQHRNITPFIDFIAKGTKVELEKEYVIRSIEDSISKKLTPIDKQMLQYILTNNSQNTLIDIQDVYNRFNPRKSLKYLNEELMMPLLEYGIVLKKGNTHKQIYSGNYNYNFVLNEKILDFDKSKIKRLKIEKYL